MKRSNKIAFIVVLLLVVVFGVGQFFASPITPISQTQTAGNVSATSIPATQIIAYAPAITSSTPVKSGSCWTNSIAAPYRPDAWRCAVGNGISDPCFTLPAASGTAPIGGAATAVLCGVNPQKPSSTFALKLTQALPVSQPLPTPPSANWAWLVELTDATGSSTAGVGAGTGVGTGTLCSPFTGTLPFAADGETASYGCAPGPLGDDIMIFGDLNASTSVWTAKIGTLSASTSTFPPVIENARIVNVMTVWQ